MSIDTSDINVSIEKTLEVSNVDKERKIPFSSRVKSTYASESELPVPRMLSSFSPLSSFTKLLSPIAGIDNLSVTVPPPINGWTDYDNVSDNNNKTIHLENSRIEEQNQPKTRTLQELLIRSTQPIFSVSAMFVARTSGGCGACGH